MSLHPILEVVLATSTVWSLLAVYAGFFGLSYLVISNNPKMSQSIRLVLLVLSTICYSIGLIGYVFSCFALTQVFFF